MVASGRARGASDEVESRARETARVLFGERVVIERHGGSSADQHGLLDEQHLAREHGQLIRELERRHVLGIDVVHVGLALDQQSRAADALVLNRDMQWSVCSSHVIDQQSINQALSRASV